jgi:hypothetical protein
MSRTGKAPAGYKPRIDRTLSDAQVKAIRDQHWNGCSMERIARETGISIGVIKQICARKTYKDIP